MKTNELLATNYSQIAEAIECLQQNFKDQVSLEEIAKNLNLSSVDFQNLFVDWAGVEPKKFLKYLSVKYAKQILKRSQSIFFESTYRVVGLDKSIMQDSIVEIEEMTIEEQKNNGASLSLNYSYGKSLFGNILIASTQKGICYMGFSDDNQIAFSELEKRFPKARFIQQTDELQQNALLVFSQDWSKIDTIKLHLKGTDFQFKVWKALLKIPVGSLTTYGNIAEFIQKPKAARAVGTAIGSNPIAFLIPCHRVIQSSGLLGGFMWGTTRKTAIIGWEAAKIDLV